MSKYYRAVVIGGGVVGASVLYHLAKLGWSDVALIERKELTAGSTWHAAGGFHPLNNDLNISSLQKYTINLYEEIERESGQNIGMVRSGSIILAASKERWQYLKYMKTIFNTMDIHPKLITTSEIKQLCPIVKTSDLYGGMYDEYEGHLDPHSTTVAYAKAAHKKGAKIFLRNAVLDLKPRPEGAWDVITEQGLIVAEHVVNAGGLWARKVGMMAGVNLPVTPMQHHYLVTEQIEELEDYEEPILSILDLDGFTYMRPERKGILMGVYELNPKIWHLEGAPWDYGMELIPEEFDRIAPQLSHGFNRFPILERVGVKRWVNGAFTFTPDGNPLVGPVPGLQNFWVACGVMAGFSQGGGVGLSLAQWMIDGEPEADIFGMDVARYGAFASDDNYLSETARQFYARRFVMAYPNEELPAGRPVKTSPIHKELTLEGARFGFLWGLEAPLFFIPNQPDFEETPTLKRSNAFDVIREEVHAVRSNVGLVDITGFSRFEISGPQSTKWLDVLLCSRLPAVGGVRLAPMLSESGRLMGDLTILRIAEDRFWLMGSYYLQEWHMRWFVDHLPKKGVRIKNLCDTWGGLSITGPNSRNLLTSLTSFDVSNQNFPFMRVRKMDVGGCLAIVARLSVTGELGYEINLPFPELPKLYRQLQKFGVEFGLKPFGFRAMNSLRLEKGFGVWSREFTRAYTPEMSGLIRFVYYEKEKFIGKDAAMRQLEQPNKRKLVLLKVDADGADVSGFEPVTCEDRKVGFVTSGDFGHWVQESLAFAYVNRDILKSNLSVDVVGKRQSAHVLSDIPYDLQGIRMRS